MKYFLRLDYGPKHKDQNAKTFKSDGWAEKLLDIDSKELPDVVGAMTDMSAVNDSSMQAVFSSHNIERLYPHELPLASGEFIQAFPSKSLLNEANLLELAKDQFPAG